MGERDRQTKHGAKEQNMFEQDVAEVILNTS